MNMKKIIVDCDAGSDDAVALVLLIEAHKRNKIKLMAITCVAGNTTVNNVVKNVFRTLETCDTFDIPVYKGAHSSLLSLENSGVTPPKYHGEDGFGDVFNDDPDVTQLQTEHAMIAMHKLITEQPNEISIVGLGPLTNIALAIRVFPQILHDVKEFYVMGGNSTARGNTTSTAEFNFYIDPESVHILLQNNTKPLWLLPWETCLLSTITHEWRDNVLGKKNTKITQFINAIEAGVYSKQTKRNFYGPCDAFLAAVILQPDIINTYVKYYADIELAGLKTRGQVVLHHLQTDKSNVHLIDNFNFHLFEQLMLSAFDSSHIPNIL